ncbi:MAG: alpha-amylase, partial [Maritimibacter sp.]|nr:alpha-amylase [Maritimibacter sp.]
MVQRSHSFGARLTRLVARIYPGVDADILASQVIDAFWPEGTHRRTRPRRPGNTLWSQRDAMLITYGDSIVDGVHKPLSLLHDFLLTHLQGVVNGVHVLPFFPWTSDDGFAVTDYRKVDGKLGDWADITRIGQDFHLMSDLVLNHVSSQSGWFNEFLQDHAPYNRFFVTADPSDDLTAVVRPRVTPLLREVETAAGTKHVWCTFGHDQVDLDFSNPEVLLEMLRVIRLHVDMGVRIIRLDA